MAYCVHENVSVMSMRREYLSCPSWNGDEALHAVPAHAPATSSALHPAFKHADLGETMKFMLRVRSLVYAQNTIN